MPATLHIFVVHTQHLKLRAMHIHGVVQKLRLAALAENYDVNTRLVLSPDASDVENNISEYQKDINYDPVNDPTYDNFRAILSPEMLSNTLKHLQAWKQISEMQNVHSDDLFMVIEDDSFAVPDIVDTFRTLLKTVSQNRDSWDVTLLGITSNETNSSTLELRDVVSVAPNVIPSKDSYLIKPHIAKRCLDDWRKYKFIMRVQWSYWLSQNKDVKVRIPSKRVLLDASKLGIVPSSIHANNILVFNREFVELVKITNLPVKDLLPKIKIAEQLYNAVAHMNSPDIMGVYGMLLYKCGKFTEAKKLFMNAVHVMNLHHCKVHSTSDLYQYLVKVHEQLQDDIANIIAKPSYYDDAEKAKSDL